MEPVTGIGGIFFRAPDPDALARWSAEHLGIDNQPEGGASIWWQERRPTVSAPFPTDSDSFGRPEQAWMLNQRPVWCRLGDCHADCHDSGLETWARARASATSTAAAGSPSSRSSNASQPLARP